MMDDELPTSIELNITKSGPKRLQQTVKKKVRGKRALNFAPPVDHAAKAANKKNKILLDEFYSGIDLNEASKKVKKDDKKEEKPIKKETKSSNDFDELDEEFNQLKKRKNLKGRSGEKFTKPAKVPEHDDVDDDFFERGQKRKYNGNSHEKSNVFKVTKDGKTFVPSLFSNNPETPIINLKKVKPVKELLFSKKKFADFKDLHPHLVSCLKSRLNVEEMTRVQQSAIPPLVSGKDCLIKSATGSGKTLSYLVPIVQKLQSIEPKLQRSDGIHCLIIVPTRELVAQCFNTLADLCRSFTWLVPGCLMGGEKKKSEKSRIRKGITILVSTPGRLIDHMETTKNLKFNKVQYFVIDEADRLHEQGFEESLSKIIDHLKDECETRPQCVLLSATLSSSVQDLAGMTLTDPQLIDLCDSQDDIEKYALPPQLDLHYIVVPAKLRLISLCSFIVDQISKRKLKALIFMSTQDSVDFHHGIFTKLFSPLLEKSQLTPVKFFRLHGNMEQKDRMSVFNSFQSIPAGILLCTDVAARGLDLPLVDWIIQYSCPSKIGDFVHRVGRTARIGAKGDALLFLLPAETGFLNLLQDALQINFSETSLEDLIKTLLLVRLEGKFLGTRNPREYAAKLQQDLEKALYEDECLLNLAKKAFLAFLRAYASYPRETRTNLPFKELHIGHIATSFLLHDSPKDLGAAAFTYKQTQLRTYRRLNPYNKECRDPKRGLPVEMRASEFDSGIASKKRKT
ncbi:probable ATP-dependent RNA helicase DDX31 [Tetranychus urticae]|uniref:ATP-dependent RNA helicase n=1 Tax=Tetranychus urticae TaxID=32264 RepID=T1KDG1_TETUR|nr:probable ATP-dependent RNA helicase DDX31 [Tetranychus urticae]